MTWFTAPFSPPRTQGTRFALPVALVALGCLAASTWLMLSGADQQLSRSLILWVNERPDLNYILNTLSDVYEFKGVIAALVVWWLCFRHDRDQSVRDRIAGVATIAVTFTAIVVGRITANTFPFRPRPLADPDVAGAWINTDQFFRDWSSFPSDHAMIFGAFAVAVIHIAPRLGWSLLGLHAVLLVSLPRVLVGKHYASDVLAGLAVGAAIGWLLFPLFVRGITAAWAKVPAHWRREDLGYPLLFLVTFEIATNFDGARRILRALVNVLS